MPVRKVIGALTAPVADLAEATVRTPGPLRGRFGAARPAESSASR